VVTVKKKVTPTALQKVEPRLPGGHETVVPVRPGALLEQPVGVVLESGEAALDEQARRRVEPCVLLERHHDGADDRVADHDGEQDQRGDDEVEGPATLLAAVVLDTGALLWRPVLRC
jgi:hypothetical protein